MSVRQGTRKRGGAKSLLDIFPSRKKRRRSAHATSSDASTALPGAKHSEAGSVAVDMQKRQHGESPTASLSSVVEPLAESPPALHSTAGAAIHGMPLKQDKRTRRTSMVRSTPHAVRVTTRGCRRQDHPSPASPSSKGTSPRAAALAAAAARRTGASPPTSKKRLPFMRKSRGGSALKAPPSSEEPISSSSSSSPSSAVPGAVPFTKEGDTLSLRQQGLAGISSGVVSRGIVEQRRSPRRAERFLRHAQQLSRAKVRNSPPTKQARRMVEAAMEKADTAAAASRARAVTSLADRFLHSAQENLSETFGAAYTVEEELDVLPIKYENLRASFDVLETVVNMQIMRHGRRRLDIFFDEIQPHVQRICKRSFDIEDFQRIMHVYPEAYRVRAVADHRTRARRAAVGVGCTVRYKIAPTVEQTQAAAATPREQRRVKESADDAKVQMGNYAVNIDEKAEEGTSRMVGASNGLLLKRRMIFEERLRRLVDGYRRDSVARGSRVRTGFVPDIECATLPVLCGEGGGQDGDAAAPGASVLSSSPVARGVRTKQMNNESSVSTHLTCDVMLGLLRDPHLHVENARMSASQDATPPSGGGGAAAAANVAIENMVMRAPAPRCTLSQIGVVRSAASSTNDCRGKETTQKGRQLGYLRNVDPRVLAAARARQRYQTEDARLGGPEKRALLARIQQLPKLVHTLRSLFMSRRRRSAMPYEEVIRSVSRQNAALFGERSSFDLLVRTLAKLVPDWCVLSSVALRQQHQRVPSGHSQKHLVLRIFDLDADVGVVTRKIAAAEAACVRQLDAMGRRNL